jgi:riboflavin synthase
MARDVFTGLIEEVGVLAKLSPSSGGGARVRIQAEVVTEGLKMGDSIAVNGTCLTAVAWDLANGWIEFDAVAETLRLTTLKSMPEGTRVNLERALAVGSRVGGHYVTGHVDGHGQLLSRNKEGNGVVYRFAADSDLMALIAPKGSIAVDGISLTVVDVFAEGFSVWIVPHTSEATNLANLSPGDSVNLETDILAKYVARMVCQSGQGGTVSMTKLQEAGFLS